VIFISNSCVEFLAMKTVYFARRPQTFGCRNIPIALTVPVMRHLLVCEETTAHDPSPGSLGLARICRYLAVSRKPVSSCRFGLN
jgi:hypothetical protein